MFGSHSYHYLSGGGEILPNSGGSTSILIHLVAAPPSGIPTKDGTAVATAPGRPESRDIFGLLVASASGGRRDGERSRLETQFTERNSKVMSDPLQKVRMIRTQQASTRQDAKTVYSGRRKYIPRRKYILFDFETA